MQVQVCLILCAVLCVTVLISTSKARSCTVTRARYLEEPYTTYYSSSYSYYYSCGFLWLGRCRGTRYRRNSGISYRNATEYYSACCSGYTCSSDCQACCLPSCQNGGTCNTPNNCDCPSGWTGSYCQNDVDECLGSNRCHAKANCINNRGSYSCTCRTGYQGNGYSSCRDINECLGSNGCSSSATCHNTAGSYTCTCNSGYQGNGYWCSDDNECVSGHRCDTNARCTNTIGSYSCSCNTGFTGNGRYCSDVNECQLNTDQCHGQATCRNTVGSYSCTCNNGYSGNGRTCRDVNECSSGNGGCDQECTNSVGSYQCTCRNGYYLETDRHSCKDVNECGSGNGGCHHTCHNTVGSYHCLCNNGYSLSEDNHTCTVPPSPPTNVQVSQVSTQTARVTWRAPTVSFSNSLTRVSFYRIVARQSSFDIPDVVVYVPSTQTSYSFPSTLEEFTAYTCEVFANNSFGYGRSGHAVRFKTLETIPSAPPRVGMSEALSSSIISIHWQPPLSIHINGMLQYYLVNVTETTTGKKWQFHAVGSDLRVGSLHPYYNYAFTITARTIGNGPYSPTMTVRTLQDAPSGPPQYLSVSRKNSTSLTLTWQVPPASQQNGDIQLYTISLKERETDMTMEYTAHGLTFTVHPLHPHYHYEARVRAETISPGPYTSDSVQTQLHEAAPSSSPTVVAINAINSTSLYLEWTPPPPADHNGEIRSYTIIVHEQNTGLTTTYQSASTSKTITLLHPYYVYRCQVLAFTVSNGPPSDPEYVTTFEDGNNASLYVHMLNIVCIMYTICTMYS